MPHRPLAWIDDELAALAAQDLLRQLPLHQGEQGAVLEVNGRSLVNFGSNDYLGLAADPRLIDVAMQATQCEGWGAGASPLVVGRSESHRRLEVGLAEFEQTEAALLFSSGFAANVGAITALVGRGDAVFGDQLNHASLIDGCRLSRADSYVYPHSDVGQLAELLKQSLTKNYRRRLIVTDSLFSMDGDLAPLVEIAALAEQYDCMLLIDEAHATGVFGEQGRGVAQFLGCDQGVHVRVGTLSKALGSAGGFVSGPRNLIDWLANRARPYVFSTASPPAVSAAALAALEIVRDEPQRRRSLLHRAAALRENLRAQGWQIGLSASQIIPIMIGESARALALSANLREQGLLVPAIRPPSVPAGEARLRLSLSAGHSDEMIERLEHALASRVATVISRDFSAGG
jgi:8-amino-7-oxononanoate synthase